jgi:hypothetical protein
MKITKEQLPSKEQKKRGMQWFIKPEDEKLYDGKVKLRVTEYEYKAVIDVCSYIGKGYVDFVYQTIQSSFNEVEELIKPQTEEEPQNWLTLAFDKEAKESLVEAAGKARMTLEEFVRALVWTKVRRVQQLRKERDERKNENLRKQSIQIVNVRLTNELLGKYESKFGKIQNITDLENKLKDLLLKELA